MLKISRRVRRWRIPLLAGLFPMALSLCASAPLEEEGLEVSAAAGAGEYQYTTGGCSSPSYVNRGREMHGHSKIAYRSQRHIGVVGEVSTAFSDTYSSELADNNGNEGAPEQDADEFGRRRLMVAAWARGTLTFKYGGAELGGGLLLDKDFVGGPEPNSEPLKVTDFVLPSAKLWLGYPRYVYGWLDLIAGPSSYGSLPVTLGVGHSSEYFRAGLGLKPGLENGQNAVLLTGAYHLMPSLWLGARAHLANNLDNYGGMLTVAIPIDISRINKEDE